MREHPDQLSLGKFLAALKQAPQDHACRFDFCMTVPTNLDSYRGYYSELALGWERQDGYPEPTVGALVTKLEGQLGKIVHGYKGGEYVISPGQLVYVANYGETSSTVILGVESTYLTIIRTAWSGQ